MGPYRKLKDKGMLGSGASEQGKGSKKPKGKETPAGIETVIDPAIAVTMKKPATTKEKTK